MRKILKQSTAVIAGFICFTGLALAHNGPTPTNLTVISKIDSVSGAEIGTHGFSPDTIPGNSIKSFSWDQVASLCSGAKPEMDQTCSLDIYAKYGSATPVNVGLVTINLDNGNIYINSFHNGYKLKNTGYGEVTLSYAKA